MRGRVPARRPAPQAAVEIELAPESSYVTFRKTWFTSGAGIGARLLVNTSLASGPGLPMGGDSTEVADTPLPRTYPELYPPRRWNTSTARSSVRINDV